MYESETCFGVVSQKPLTTYQLEIEAEKAAEYVLEKYEREMVPYKCSRCGDWHLTPKDRLTPSRTCPYCIDSCGAPKQAYDTESGAKKRAQILYKERGVRLYVYRCECGYGWHLTKTP